jgi:hypothetical protein
MQQSVQRDPGDKHVDFIIDWLKRVQLEKEKNQNANKLNVDAIQQLNKSAVLLFIFQVTLIIFFAVFGVIFFEICSNLSVSINLHL